MPRILSAVIAQAEPCLAHVDTSENSTLTVTKPTSVDSVTASLLSGPVAIYNAAGVKVRAIEHCTSREELTEVLAPGAYTVKGGGATVKIIKQ